ncbi:hypothetical protein EIB75_07780 [Epilithonimonas vandammei]|uniref:Uncharacterized protein n=1 Tax=Epilithonimonas vandammei TaxID=2487072 RepID=A0A3G8ZEE3_9FLAO|nr:hypothetical protein [Epilithonimonas vandammei]AZI55145.1 hypothetical protein EIB75_07780 [Epilithonimonas vandammei]
MEILLNELSIHNQFTSFEDFKTSALIEIIKFLRLHKEGCITLFKKSDIYSREVYNGNTLHSLMISSDMGRTDEMRKFKSQLFNIFDDPYWDSKSLCVENSKYLYEELLVNNSALAECYERNSSLISLIPSDYSKSLLEVLKDNIPQDLLNFVNVEALVLNLYTNSHISFEVYCKNFYTLTKLNFSKINSNDSFNLITDSRDEVQFKNSFDMFSEASWSDIIKQGGKGDGKVGLAYEKYHDQNYFISKYSLASDEVVYKFRVTQKYRGFGYRKKDVFYLLEFDLTHRLSD